MQYNQLRYYPDGVAEGRGDFRGVSLATQPDLASLGKPFDMFGATASSQGDLERTLRHAINTVNAGTSVIVNVIVVK